MRKTLERKSENVLTVDVETLAGMLNCGRVTAAKIGSEAGARIQIGRRVLYKVSLIENYLNSLSGE